MRSFAALLCIYLLAMTLMPTVRVVKAYSKSGCATACHSAGRCHKDKKMPCENENCILSYQMITAYLVAPVQQLMLKQRLKSGGPDNNWHIKSFISAYSGSAWHPPENRLV